MQEKKLEQCMVVMIVLVIVDINLQKEEKNASDKECPTTCELLRIEEERIGDRPQRNHCSKRTSRDYLLLWRSDLRPLLLLQPDGSSLTPKVTRDVTTTSVTSKRSTIVSGSFLA